MPAWASIPAAALAALVRRLLTVTEPLVAVRFGGAAAAGAKGAPAPVRPPVRAGSHSMVDRVVRLLQVVQSPGWQGLLPAAAVAAAEGQRELIAAARVLAVKLL